MGSLVGKAQEDDEAFWGHDTWAEDNEDNESFHESDEDSEARVDEFDSDFDESESDNEQEEAAAGLDDEMQLRRDERHRQRKTPLSQGNKPNAHPKPGKRRPADCYTTGSYRRAIHRGCDKKGIPKCSHNRIRHTAGTEIRQKFRLEAAQTVLGHASAAVTQIYAERDMALAASIAKELG